MRHTITGFGPRLFAAGTRTFELPRSMRRSPPPSISRTMPGGATPLYIYQRPPPAACELDSAAHKFSRSARILQRRQTEQLREQVRHSPFSSRTSTSTEARKLCTRCNTHASTCGDSVSPPTCSLQPAFSLAQQHLCTLQPLQSFSRASVAA